ncbi:hypothetical protein ACFSCW_09015 [Sphingomonas tabacisoli]|uniref:Uncharacterized protein n=1 Tax=Sphingomonas tabacisoli TaxID=2249466 RepID=A0ABW4I3S1_9SPHN
MAQLFSGIVFTLIAAGALAFLVSMLRSEWDRVAAILAGEELAHARSIATRPVRVRVRKSWRAPERRRVQPLRAAA